MSVGQKLTMLKIRSTRVTFLSLSNLEAAPEEAMQLRRLIKTSNESLGPYTDRKNVTDFLYLVLRLACKVTCYFQLFILVLVSVLRTSINVLSKSKSKNYVTWIANLTKLFLSV